MNIYELISIHIHKYHNYQQISKNITTSLNINLYQQRCKHINNYTQVSTNRSVTIFKTFKLEQKTMKFDERHGPQLLWYQNVCKRMFRYLHSGGILRAIIRYFYSENAFKVYPRDMRGPKGP